VGRKVVFVGDITDRGRDNITTLLTVMALVEDGVAFCVQGNHDNKLFRALKGNDVTVSHGLELTLAELEKFYGGNPGDNVMNFLENLPLILKFPVEGHPTLVVAHAGICVKDLDAPVSKRIKKRCLYGIAHTGEDGTLIREHNWTENWEHEKDHFLVYGHTTHPEPVLTGNSINIDTGCWSSGVLTAFRYPERQIVQAMHK
jgi:protein phosphatase